MEATSQNNGISRLNLAQTLKVSDYIRPNIESLIKLPPAKVAQMATETTGIPVNETNVRYIVKSIGHSFERQQPPSAWERQNDLNLKMITALLEIAVEVRNLQSEIKVMPSHSFRGAMQTIDDMLNNISKER